MVAIQMIKVFDLVVPMEVACMNRQNGGSIAIVFRRFLTYAERLLSPYN